ncbi:MULTISPECIES: ATP-binding cassette domain-containing protein [Halolamina]|uniref:Cobalamin import ATP-binding protein BtuD n=1 Tax=Halolamina pelagica TaxID=699431 RepID=A0A1I5NKF5_9EURY|nr:MULTISPECIES: ATP-binding cassette domain-containing protein [Halolamina]NHX36335.1 ATP-binding cassette domain-containing protein [Halolamina sp. R1-12]SFP21691.1 iron complex transport system ATP-binding protein [Halolamina pelagica]
MTGDPTETAVPTPTDDPVLSIDDLSVTLGETDVLDGVSLEVERGELVGLVGPNGAGKTTLLRTARGTLSPDSGQVRVAGDPVADLPARAVGRRVATVPQDTSLSFAFSVREIVAMGRTPHVPRFSAMDEADHAAVERAMERTEVTEFAERPVPAVSGGERSRVLLARALAQDTPLLLLDEPTASLDPNHRLRTFETVAELAGEGRAAIAAIHDLDTAARYCDRIVVVADGGIVADGPPESVLTGSTVGHAFDVDAVVTPDPVTERPRVTALPDVEPADDAPEIPPVDRVHVVAGGGRAGPLLTRLDRAGLEATVGPLSAGDSDAAVADALGMSTLEVGALDGVDDATLDRLRTLVERADAVVVADVDLTAGLAPVLSAVADSGTPAYCIEERPTNERTVAEAAAAAYRRLRVGEAGVAASTPELLDVLA